MCFRYLFFIAKAIGSFANLRCKREDCCLAVNSLECQTSISFIKSVIGQVISLQLAVLLISSHIVRIINIFTPRKILKLRFSGYCQSKERDLGGETFQSTLKKLSSAGLFFNMTSYKF